MFEADVACVVPARLGSTRFPRKLLQPLQGRPVVVHTLERAAEAGCFSEVICVTDSLEIGEAAAQHGFRYALTGDAVNGTERIGRNLDSVSADLIVNLQGDEPVFPVEGLVRLCAALREHPEWVHTLVHEEAPSPEDLINPNRVKALLDQDGFVSDFVRHAPVVVGTRHAVSRPTNACRIHLGAYAYSKNFLRRYAASPVSRRETELSHEMLRDPGLAPLRAHPAPPGSPVDVPADLAAVRARLEARQPQGVPT